MDAAAFRTLGRSGLIVSPLALGTMTFGAGRWGADEATAGAIFDAYIETGGNFIDTADVYSGGESEAMLGCIVAARPARQARDRHKVRLPPAGRHAARRRRNYPGGSGRHGTGSPFGRGRLGPCVG